MLDPTSLAYLRYREREKEKGTISFVRLSMYIQYTPCKRSQLLHNRRSEGVKEKCASGIWQHIITSRPSHLKSYARPPYRHIGNNSRFTFETSVR